MKYKEQWTISGAFILLSSIIVLVWISYFLEIGRLEKIFLLIGVSFAYASIYLLIHIVYKHISSR